MYNVHARLLRPKYVNGPFSIVGPAIKLHDILKLWLVIVIYIGVNQMLFYCKF